MTSSSCSVRGRVAFTGVVEMLVMQRVVGTCMVSDEQLSIVAS